MKLEIETTRQPGVVIAALRGSINAANADEVFESLLILVEPGSKLVLAAAGLEFVSSAGLRLILKLYRAVAIVDGRLILTELSPEVREVMHVTGFLQHFTCSETLAEALN